MRFVLDHDLDVAECRSALLDHGHEVLTAYEAGVEGDDDDVTAYGMAKDAVVITHDKEFTKRRIEWPVGLHVQMRCKEWDIGARIRQTISRLERILAAFEDLTIVVSADGNDLYLHYPSGGQQAVTEDHAS